MTLLMKISKEERGYKILILKRAAENGCVFFRGGIFFLNVLITCFSKKRNLFHLVFVARE